MATRTTIKSKAKAKAGAVLATAAAGMAFTSEAAELSPLEANAALLDAAFKLLEEGQQQALNAVDPGAANQFAQDQAAAQHALDNDELTALMPSSQAGVQMAAASPGTMTDLPTQMLAQAETAVGAVADAAGGAAGSAAGGAGTAAGAGAATAAGSGAAAGAGIGAAASGAGALVAAAPLATMLGVGAGVVGVAAVANNVGSDSGTAGTDLNDGNNISGLAIDNGQASNIVGKSVDKTDVTFSDATTQKLSLIGSSYLDHSLDNQLGG